MSEPTRPEPIELGGLLAALQAPAPSPAGGTAAAAAGAMAASLVVMVAQASPAWVGGAAAADAAAGLRDRLLQLGADDVEAFAAVLAAQRATADLDGALLGAARVPLAIAECSATVAELAAAAQESGKSPLRPDAVAAAILARAATQAAAQLVGVNLARLSPGHADDERTRLHRAAAAAESRAVATAPA